MKLVAFRITNFKSIVDTGWRDLSSDNITGLIGQNESGKSSVLQALYSFYTGGLDEDYLRSDGEYPTVSCSFSVTESELGRIFEGFDFPVGLVEQIKQLKYRINFIRTWTGITPQLSKFDLEQEALVEFFANVEASTPTVSVVAEVVSETVASTPSGEHTEEPDPLLLLEDFAGSLMEEMPVFELFEDNASLLPAKIDLSDIKTNNTKVRGIKGAQNFLTIVGLTPEDILNGNERIVDSKIQTANRDLTKDFQSFWSQYVGKNNKIEIAFGLKHHDDSNAATAGQPYLIFWVKDGNELLHPAQRSQGVQWFLSFFLQLRASALLTQKGQVLLIDEPGARLHARAQEDVLKVFEDIKDSLQIIYTTHSPYLIDATTLYRLLAVQRSVEDDENSETRVLGVHHLSAASDDTLLPIYTLIGVSLQHQRVIKAKNNVILEEASAFYYLKAFKHLLGNSQEINFIPSSGVAKIPLLVNLFLGWGLDFIVLTDDDEAGKKVRRKLKADIYGDDTNEAKKHLLAIADSKGVEDLFTKGNFKELVLGDKNLAYTEDNSAYMNHNKESKVLSAVKFCQAVEKGEVTYDSLGKTTQDNIKKLFDDLATSL